MGAESDAYIMVDPDGNARAAAGVCATVRDIARLGQVIMDPASGRVSLPESWVVDMLHYGSREAHAAGTEGEKLNGLFDTASYRSYWVADSDTQTLMASGTNGQILLVDCKSGIAMAKTSSQPDRTSWPKIRLTIRAFREFARLLERGKSTQT
nr:6-aminohexanoate-dimer hydrolase [Quercus suber]